MPDPTMPPFRPDPSLREVDELPPREVGWWGPETVVCNGVRYGRCHGGTWIEQGIWCDWAWGDFACAKRAHGPQEKHHAEWWTDLVETRQVLAAKQPASTAHTDEHGFASHTSQACRCGLMLWDCPVMSVNTDLPLRRSDDPAQAGER